jgi:hypothetical protein
MSKRALPALLLALFLSASLQAQKLPRPLPDFKVQMPDGKEVALRSFKGKVVVFAFILTTCPHCQTYTRYLGKMHYEFAQRGLQIVESAIEENPKPNVPGFVRAFAPPFPVGYNDYPLANVFLEIPRTQAVKTPAVVFIDRNSMIVGQFMWGDAFIENNSEKNLRDAVMALLNGKFVPPPPAKKTDASLKQEPKKK